MGDAQRAKVRRALRMTDVGVGSRVLEIGCGWGALAEMATLDFGASVTGVTLSTEQLAFANARMKWNGKAEKQTCAYKTTATLMTAHTMPSAQLK